MTWTKCLAGAALTLALLCSAAGDDAITGSVRAQAYYYQCPAGYYWDPSYGCLPLRYFYGPPTYVYPDIGFGLFYGGRWYARPHPHARPGAPHGGAPHGALHGAPHGVPHGAPHGHR